MPRGNFIDELLADLGATMADRIAEAIGHQIGTEAPRARRVSSKAPKQPKPPKAAKVKRDTRTFYDELEVSRTASAETIRAAYLSLSKRFHPDVAKFPNAAARMKLINAAHDVLSDPAKRREYDKQLREGR